jgi:hypothetical protein
MRRSPLALVAAAALAAGCATHRPAPAARPAEGSPGTGSGIVPGVAGAQPTPRQLVRRGHEGVTVDDVEAARRRLERAAEALGAEVARLEVREAERADYLLRVPPGRLDALMDSAAALGTLDERTVSAEDVTAEVVDAEGRLAALRASRDRLRQLLERAGSVADVVTVEHELARVQAELESLEGRLAALRGQVARAELTVRLERRQVLGPLAILGLGLARGLQKLFIWR